MKIKIMKKSKSEIRIKSRIVAGVGTPTPVNPHSLSPNSMEFSGPHGRRMG